MALKCFIKLNAKKALDEVRKPDSVHAQQLCGDERVEQRTDAEVVVPIQADDVVVRSVKDLDDGWVRKKGTERRDVAHSEWIDDVIRVEVTELDQTDLFLVRIGRVTFSVQSNYRGVP